MHCQEAWDALSATTKGEDRHIRIAEAEAHASVCAACAHDREFLRALSRLRLDAPTPEPPESLRDSILRATIGRSSVRRFWDSVRPIPHIASAAAAAALAFIVFASAPSRFENVVTPDNPSSRAHGSVSNGRIQARKPRPSAQQAANRETIQIARVSAQSHRTLALEAPESAAALPPLLSRAQSGARPLDTEIERVIPENPNRNMRAEVPEPDKPAAGASVHTDNPRIERAPFEAPVEAETDHEPVRVARAEERPLPPPGVEVTEMEAGSGGAAYTMEAKGSMDPRAVASLADIRRSIQKESDEEPLTTGAFRMNDRREVRLAVHTSKF